MQRVSTSLLNVLDIGGQALGYALLLCLGVTTVSAQTPFRCDNTLYQTIKVGSDMWLYTVESDPVALQPVFNLTAAGAVGELNAVALNPVDGFMYALQVQPPYSLYRIDGAGTVDSLGVVTGDPGFEYPNAGAITIDGRYMVKSVSSNRFFEVDLTTRYASLLCDFTAEPDMGFLGDFAINPLDGQFYGFGGKAYEFIRFDPATCVVAVDSFSGHSGDGLGAVWIDASGNTFGYSNASGELVSIDLATKVATVVGSGASTTQTDGCSCSGVDLFKRAERRTLSKRLAHHYQFEFYNNTGDTIRNLRFEDVLPSCMAWIGGIRDITPNGFVATQASSAFNEFFVDIATLPPGTSSFVLRMYVNGACPQTEMSNQATLSGLGVALGTQILSDDPTTPAIDDPTVSNFYENCSNGIDDDGDNLADGADDDCTLGCYAFADLDDRTIGLAQNFASEFVIGQTAFPDIEAVEFDPRSGKLYGADADTWVEIDVTNGTGTKIGEFDDRASLPNGVRGLLPLEDVDGLARDPVNDVWYAAARIDDGNSCNTDVLFLVDETTGLYVQGAFPDHNNDGQPDDYLELKLPAAEACYGYADDLGFNPYTGRLYGVFNGSGSNSYHLRTFVMLIDPLTGQCTSQGEIFFDDGSGSTRPLADVEGFTYTLDGRVLATTGNSSSNDILDRDGLFELSGVGSGGIITATKLLDLAGRDYEALTCITYANPAELGGRVYLDRNGNATRDAGDSNAAGILVGLINQVSGDTVSIATTDANGLYSFVGIAPERYNVVVLGSNRSAGGPLFTTSLTEDPDGTLDHQVSTAFLLPGSSTIDLDFGYQPNAEVCGNGLDDDLDGTTDCPSIRGRLFEDVNYGGGAGRTYAEANTSAQSSGWANGEIALSTAQVQLYNASNTLVQTVTTSASGYYEFEEVPPGDYEVRPLATSIVSNRPATGATPAAVPVQTYRRSGGTHHRNEVGGPAISAVTVPVAGDVTNRDFGFSFSVITSTADAGAGSLRQWILNANALGNSKLDLEDAPTGRPAFTKGLGEDVSVFELPGTGTHALSVTTQLPRLTDANSVLSGYTQAFAKTGPIATRDLRISLTAGSGSLDGIQIGANQCSVSGLSITGFIRGIELATSGVSGYHLWGNSIGMQLDGTTPVSNTNAGIALQNAGSGTVGTNGDGIADDVEGNLISGNNEGISVRACDAVLIAGNYIGVDAAGTTAVRNRYNGVHLRDLTVGSVVGFDESRPNLSPANARNLISGNGTDGVRLTSCSQQWISGNFIGTDRTGTLAVPNVGYGVQLIAACSNNLIGTNADGARDVNERNIISGNGSGFRMMGTVTGDNNRIAGNYIGVDVTGNTALPNANNGLNFDGTATRTRVGTNGDGLHDDIERNVISGNVEDGIRIVCNDVQVSGNYIGVGANGTTSIGNGKRGIFLDASPSDNCFGYCSGMTNSEATEVGNVIANNSDSGIGFATTSASLRNRISRNSFYNNASLAIDLGYDLVTPNDNGDADAGPNTLLNFPLVTYARVAAGQLRVKGFAPAGSRLEIYVADAGVTPSPLPSGYTSSFGEGERYVTTVEEGSGGDLAAGTGTYTNDGTGATSSKTTAQFELVVAAPAWLSTLGPGTLLTATATDAQDNTSEFGPRITLNIAEDCTNGVDDDGDFLVDCADEECPGANPAGQVNQ